MNELQRGHTSGSSVPELMSPAAMTELLATAIYRARVCQVPAHVLAQTIMAAIQTEVTRAKGELLECMRTASGVGP